MTKDSTTIERIAVFMKDEWGSTAKAIAKRCLEGDWKLWKQVDKKIMKDEKLSKLFIEALSQNTKKFWGSRILIRADLPTCCKTFASILPSSQ